MVVVRGLVEQPGARAVVGATVRGAEVVDAGVARKIAAGLIIPRGLAAVAEPARIGEALMAAAHHRADAVEQQRTSDHAGRGRRRGPEKGTAAAKASRRSAIGL